MVKPLLFKGDKKPKKRKRAAKDDDDPDAPTSKALTTTAMTTTNEDNDDDDDSWVNAEALADLTGPIIFVLPTEPASCLACDANGKVFALEVENMAEGNPATAEPHDVRQVWVANRVAGTETFTFKGHHGRYLGCDKFGIPNATKEAISPEESWTSVPIPDNIGTFALQSQREKFISIEEGKDVAATSIRGDAEDIGFKTTLRVRMQARFKPKLKVAKADKAREKISRKELEEAVGRRLDDEDVKLLKRARREGNYHEALLDVKVKGKHDKFA
ncbi:hypothetical protein FH972_026553 [Carpinus fangiana]|uniref:Actin-crosslinking protein n=1 Tax=Carpinus fangiana TaxID=176857 RepID=A0A5N6L4F2_9ROSI|nr:hypothetical protein FH972_026553 [Carpinus fangiana]